MLESGRLRSQTGQRFPNDARDECSNREAGKSDEALAEAQEAARLDPDSVDAHLVTAQLQQLRGEADGSEDALRAAACNAELRAQIDVTRGMLQAHREQAHHDLLFVGLEASTGVLQTADELCTPYGGL